MDKVQKNAFTDYLKLLEADTERKQSFSSNPSHSGRVLSVEFCYLFTGWNN
jgi:hypothetical protein